MDFKQCAACRERFRRYPQVPQQRYCSEVKCQLERRRRSQVEALKNDPAYKENLSRAQKTWRDENPDYSRNYRQANPEYRERNRIKQRERNAKRKSNLIAKKGASNPPLPLLPGRYQLVAVDIEGIAKNDVWTVEIKILSDT